MSTFLVGFGAGILLTALVSWVTVRSYLRRVRDAERRARAAEHMAEIGSMTGGLAHEIKNPLSTIGLNVGLLTESIEALEIDPGERSRLLNRMRALEREIERLRGILTDFLEFAGKVHLSPERIDLNRAAEELVDFYVPEATRNNVRIRVELSDEPLVADADVRLVKQALLNLMLNATQAMSNAAPRGSDAGGELILRTARARAPDGRRAAQLHVIDTGPGMDEQTLERIFTPYFTTKSGGSGLGLPTARRLIEAHDGRIDVHSEEGRGTDFVVTLPLAD